MKKLILAFIFLFYLPLASTAQFSQGDGELMLSGAGQQTHNEGYNSLYISISAGYGMFINSNIQLGGQIAWYYSKFNIDTYYVEHTNTSKQAGLILFTNYNFNRISNVTPYATTQIQIQDLELNGDRSLGDIANLNIGGGLRFFLVKNASINTSLLYSYPLKDAEYKDKSFTLNVGISIFI